MRHLILSLAAFVAMTFAADARELPTAKLMAVYAYADWCPNCKLMSPNLQKAREGLAGQPVLFVTLDLTDKPKIHNSILLAQALGIGEFLKAQGSATGYVALLDARSKKELARFDRESSAESIQAEIEKRLK